MRHDLDVVTADTRHAVEVTRAADQARAARDASLGKLASAPLGRPDHATQSWLITLLPDAYVRGTLAQVEEFVARLEVMGRDRWFHGDRTYECFLTDEDQVQLQRLAVACGVECASAVSTVQSPAIFVQAGGAGGSSHPEVIVSAAETEAPANASKLGRALTQGRDRAHLFIWSHETRWDLTFALERADPQRAREPTLPDEVHEAWVAVDIPCRTSANVTEPPRLIVWHWDGGAWSAQELIDL